MATDPYTADPYTAALAARLQTNSDPQVANASGNLRASEPWLFLFGFGHLTMLSRQLDQ